MIRVVLVWAISAYLAPGLLFALWFCARGVVRLDPVAAGSNPAFRLLILPGAAALWPVLLLKLARGGPS